MNPFIARLAIAQFFFAIPAIFNIVDRKIINAVLSWLQHLASDPAHNGLAQEKRVEVYTASPTEPDQRSGVKLCDQHANYLTAQPLSDQDRVACTAYGLFGSRLMFGSLNILVSFSEFCEKFHKQYPNEPDPSTDMNQLVALLESHKHFKPEAHSLTDGFIKEFEAALGGVDMSMVRMPEPHDMPPRRLPEGHGSYKNIDAHAAVDEVRKAATTDATWISKIKSVTEVIEPGHFNPNGKVVFPPLQQLTEGRQPDARAAVDEVRKAGEAAQFDKPVPEVPPVAPISVTPKPEAPKPPARVFEKIARPWVPALDDILGIPFEALSDGFIRVIDYMGNDASIVQAARVSYGAGTKTSREDSALIDYLMRKHHTTPFEMCSIKLHIRMPMDSWRQAVRNRTAKINEYSTRYSVAIDACDTTKPEAWRLQSTTNKQGSGGFLDFDKGAYLSEREHSLQALAREVYAERLAMGVAREQARKDLPLSNYTEAYWKIDLHNLLNHFLALRMSEHAQLEIRSYANIIGDIVAKWVPATWAAFQDHRLSAMPMSGHEIEFVSLLLGGQAEAARKFADEHGLSKGTKRGEVEVKLKRLGAFKLLPWT